MRTTLEIDDDVLLAAKAEARQSRQTIGAIVSQLARQGLQGSSSPPRTRSPQAMTARKLAKLGIQPLSFRRGAVVSDEIVQRIRDEEGI